MKPYGLPNSLDRIKFIALVIMTIDHVGCYIFPEALMWRAIGRITMPVWFFLVGFYTAKSMPGNWSHYMKKWRIYFFYVVVLALLKFVLSTPIFPLKALASMFCCQAMLLSPVVRRKLDKTPFEIPVLLLFFLVPTTLLTEYGSQGFLFAVVGYWVSQKQIRWETWATAVFSYLLYCVAQIFCFGFGAVESIFVVIATGAVMWSLMQLEKREWKFAIDHPLFGKIACWLSRGSLHYYFIHIVVLMLIGALVHPPKVFFILKAL